MALYIIRISSFNEVYNPLNFLVDAGYKSRCCRSERINIHCAASAYINVTANAAKYTPWLAGLILLTSKKNFVKFPCESDENLSYRVRMFNMIKTKTYYLQYLSFHNTKQSQPYILH